MKHQTRINFLLFLVFILVVDLQAKPKKNNKNSRKSSKKSSKEVRLPTGFKITQDSYVAASILKTLGVKVNLETLIVKFQRNCRKLNVIKSINRSIKKIKSLTRKKYRKKFKFSKRRSNNMFNSKRGANRYPLFGPYKNKGRRINKQKNNRNNYFGNIKIGNNYDSMFSSTNKAKAKITKKKKGKNINKIKQLCKSQGYFNVSKLKGTKAKLRQLKKKN